MNGIALNMQSMLWHTLMMYVHYDLVYRHTLSCVKITVLGIASLKSQVYLDALTVYQKGGGAGILDSERVTYIAICDTYFSFV